MQATASSFVLNLESDKPKKQVQRKTSQGSWGTDDGAKQGMNRCFREGMKQVEKNYY